MSVKALRVYEDAGLLKPARTLAGWRIYGAMNSEAMKDPELAKQMPPPGVWAFLPRVFAELKKAQP